MTMRPKTWAGIAVAGVAVVVLGGVSVSNATTPTDSAPSDIATYTPEQLQASYDEQVKAEQESGWTLMGGAGSPVEEGYVRTPYIVGPEMLKLGEVAVFYDVDKKPIGYWGPQIGFVAREAAESGTFNWLETVQKLPNAAPILGSAFPDGLSADVNTNLTLRETIE